MIDTLLHILGAFLMMVPTFLQSTQLWLLFLWALLVALFWFTRQGAQDREKHGYWRYPAAWSAWRWAGAATPA